MIGVYITGGLGNQMFQYATARAIALRLKTDLILNTSRGYARRPYKLNHFKICPPPPKIDPNIEFKLIEEPDDGSFTDEIFSAYGNVLLSGWFQYEQYFADYSDQIRREFKLKDPISKASSSWARKILSAPVPVSIHVRRGDYQTFCRGEFILSSDYYYRCVGILKENFPEMTLYIFSDDLQWCRNHLNFEVPTYFVDANDEDHGWEDMFLISICRHHIAGNGTFSWWSAYLDNRRGTLIFYPERGNFAFHSDRFASRCIAIDS